MTVSPSEAPPAAEGGNPLDDYAASVAEAVGGEGSVGFGTIKVRIPAGRWVEALTIARDDLGLVFFSWLSAVDWSNQVSVGDPPREPVEERYEVLCTLGDLSEGRRVTFSTDLSKASASLPSLVPTFAGAEWHEREAHEMFGIDFIGNPRLVHLYLPDGFEGHPLRKSFPLLSREVKPWPGMVDVEAMPGRSAEEGPSTENPEA